MGIFKNRGIEYRVKLTDISKLSKELLDHFTEFYKIHKDYIIVIGMKSLDDRLLECNYYTNNKINWLSDYNEHIVKIDSYLNICLNKYENNEIEYVLNKLKQSDIKFEHGFYDVNYIYSTL